jgi:hypothetical protein
MKSEGKFLAWLRTWLRNGQMNGQKFFKGRSTNIHEEMLFIPENKGNTNQSHIKIPPHSC